MFFRTKNVKSHFFFGFIVFVGMLVSSQTAVIERRIYHRASKKTFQAYHFLSQAQKLPFEIKGSTKRF